MAFACERNKRQVGKRTDKQVLGDLIEQRSVEYLQQHGLRLIDKNSRFRDGEVDLILLDQQVLVFCEVRYRSSSQYGGALASIDKTKCLRISAAAEQWRHRHPRYQLNECRFDAIGVSGDMQHLNIDWRKHAFRLEDLR